MHAGMARLTRAPVAGHGLDTTMAGTAEGLPELERQAERQYGRMASGTALPEMRKTARGTTASCGKTTGQRLSACGNSFRAIRRAPQDRAIPARTSTPYERRAPSALYACAARP